MRLGPGRVAVITGAAGGIGRALSVHLARKGCDLALVDIDAAGLDETADLVAQSGRAASLHTVDVSSESQMRALPDAVLEHHSGVHLLVNNAAVSLAAPFETGSLEDMHWIMDINLWGVIHGCKFFLPHLRRQHEAHIVNVCSEFGFVGFPNKTMYCASKFAIRGFSEALRTELYGSKVGLTCVYPGAVNTNLIRRGRAWDPNKSEMEAQLVALRDIGVDRVAHKIIRAVERNRPRVRIGKDSRAVDLMSRLFPVTTNNLVSRIQHRLPFV